MSESETYLYVLRPTRIGMLTEGPTAEEQKSVSEHFAYVSGLAEDGRVLMFGRTANDDERTLGLVVFCAPTPAAADEVVRADPAVRDGVMTAECFPYRLAYLAGGDGLIRGGNSES